MIKLNISTPSEKNFEKEVEQVEIKAVEGNITILPNHTPFLSLIRNGYVKFENEQVDIEDGVVHFDKNNMYITYFK